MGDRAHVIITPLFGEGQIFVYVHWNAYNLHTIVANALDRGRPRWGDSYLARIIVSDVFIAAGINELVNAGLDTMWQESPSDYDVYVNMKDNTVTRKGKTRSFSDFIEWTHGHNGEYGKKVSIV